MSRVNNIWDDPRLPVETQEALRLAAIKTSAAGMLLMKHTDVSVTIRTIPTRIVGRVVINTCLFVGGILVCPLSSEIISKNN